MTIGYISDRLNLKERLLRIFTLISFIVSLGFFFVNSLYGIILINFALSFFRSPVIPLIDSTTLEFTAYTNEDYGKIRLWGSIGFITGTLFISFLIDFLPIETILYGMSFFLLLCFFSSLNIPTKPKEKIKIKFKEIMTVLSNHKLVILLITGLLHMMTLAGYHLFFSLYVTDIGYSNTVVGIAIFVAILSEVILFYHSKKIVRRYPPFFLLTATYFMTAIRWFILSQSQDIIFIMGTQIIHALSFGLFFIISIQYIDEQFTGRLRSIGITIFSTTVFGVGNIAGALLSGELLQNFGYSHLFYYCGFLALLTTLISLLLNLKASTTLRRK